MELDHVGLVVGDLESARALLASCGFRTTAPQRLMRTGPEGPEWSGGIQVVTMFDRGYVEVQEIRDRSRGHVLAGRADRRGVQVLALGTDDVDAEHRRLGAVAHDLPAPARWSREVEWDGASATAWFEFFPIPDELSPAALTGVVQHLTPDAARPAGIADQPNGVTALTAVVEAAPDPLDAARRYGAWTGARVEPAERGATVVLDHGRLELIAPEVCVERYGRAPGADREVVALRLEARDPHAVVRTMTGTGMEAAGTLVRSHPVLGVDLHLEAA